MIGVAIKAQTDVHRKIKQVLFILAHFRQKHFAAADNAVRKLFVFTADMGGERLFCGVKNMGEHTSNGRFSVTPGNAYDDSAIFGNRFQKFGSRHNKQLFSSREGEFTVIFFNRVGIDYDLRAFCVFFAMTYKNRRAEPFQFFGINRIARVASADGKTHTEHIFCKARKTYTADTDKMHSERHTATYLTLYAIAPQKRQISPKIPRITEFTQIRKPPYRTARLLNVSYCLFMVSSR